MTSRPFSAFEKAFYVRFQILPQSEDDRKSMPMIYFQHQVKAKRDLRRRSEQLLAAAQLIQRWFRGSRVRKSTLPKRPISRLGRVRSDSDRSSLEFRTSRAPSRRRRANSTGLQLGPESIPLGSKPRKPLYDDAAFGHHSWSASTSRVTMNEVLPCYEPSTAMKHKRQKEGSTLCSGHSGSSIETSYYSAESRLSQSTPLSIVQPVEMRQESLSDFRRLLGESRQPSA